MATLSPGNSGGQAVCPTCLEPAFRPGPSGVCLHCELAGHGMSSESLEERVGRLRAARELRWDMGVPTGPIWGPTDLTGMYAQLPGWEGYSLDVAGIPFREPVPVWPPPWPYVRVASMVFQLRLLRIRWKDSPVFGRVRWHPEHGERIDIAGLEQKHRKKDHDRADAGLRLLRTIPQLRPRGPIAWEDTVPDPIRVLEQAYYACSLRLDEVTRRDVAAELLISVGTVGRVLQRHSRSFPSLADYSPET